MALSGPNATIIVHRYHLLTGSGRRASIYFDEEQVCSLHNGKYLIIEAVPGKHKLRSSDSKHGGDQEEFKDRQIAYYRVNLEATSGFQLTDFWLLDPVPSNHAREELKSLKPREGETKVLPLETN